MANTKALRGPVRRMFTRSVQDFEAQVDSGITDKVTLKQYFKRLETHRNKLIILDQKVEEEMLAANAVEADFESEYAVVTDYQDKFVDVATKFQSLMDNGDDEDGDEDDAQSQTNRSGSSYRSAKDKKKKYKLPKLEIKKFNGNPREWLGFWSQFRTIHEDDEMASEDKFQYLVQATLEGSVAREVVESFPATSENYPKVIKYLKQRFGEDELLVEIYVRDLLRQALSINQGKSKVSIITIYDQLETKLRALESLGVTRDMNGAMLYPLVESTLPEETLRTWERVQSQTKPDNTKLTRLMEFLKVEVNSEVRVNMAKTGFGTEEVKGRKPKSSSPYSTTEEVPTAVGLHIGANSRMCIFCDKNHQSKDCFQAQKMTYEEKQSIVSKKGACFACLYPGHIFKKCKSRHKCLICGRKHYAIMCPDLHKKSSSYDDAKPKEDGGNTSMANLNRSCVFLQTLLVRLKGPHGERVIRAVLDSCSQSSYITEKATVVLGLTAISNQTLSHNLFGGAVVKPRSHKKFKVEVSSLDNEYTAQLCVLDEKKTCQSITRVTQGPWLDELKMMNIEITDVGDEDREIHLLIGADYYGHLITGNKQTLKSGPVAVQTKLGWTLVGGSSSSQGRADSTLLVTTLHVNDVDVQDMWKLDVLGIKESPESQSRDDLIKSATNHFLKTVQINKEGRYEVSLPWIEGHPPVPNNRMLAERRLNSATKRLESTHMYEAYDKMFEDWKNAGIIEETEDSIDHCSYLPHHPVIKAQSSTTPIRPVFDASARPKDSPSLNQCLEKGPNLIELIPSIMNRFRMGRFGLVTDIRKAFLQISVREEDRDFLRFLWWEKGTRKVKVYRHCRVVFGLTSSPFLLAATIAYHLDKVPNSMKTTAALLKKSLYVDNCIMTLDEEVDVSHFMKISTEVLATAEFELHDWIWNEPGKEVPNPGVPVLGLNWNVNEDTLSLDLRSVLKTDDGTVTKRKILSSSHRIFDPLGLSCPVTLIPKKIVQDIWKTKAGWDVPVSDEIKMKFETWQRDVSELARFSVKRWILEDAIDVSLHVFTDACMYAYACCIFIRIVGPFGVKVNLVMARNRLATIKKITISRLELLGCFIGAGLCAEVKKDMGFQDIPTYYWTDSSNALYWIQKNENWAEFVWNRVSEIRKISDPSAWRHIPGESNPADLPSRGCNVKQFLASRWWEGPRWLYEQEENWPKSEIGCDLSVVMSERRKLVVSALVIPAAEPDRWYLNLYNGKYFINIRKIVKVIAFLLRWKMNKDNRIYGELTTEEMNKAELCLIRIVQRESFKEEDSVLRQLHAFQDENGVWRLQTCIVQREDTRDFRQPVLLPSDHPITRMIVEDQHRRMYHSGVQVTLTSLRERFWILRARRLVRSVVHSCFRCRRFEAKRAHVIEAPLPVDRVSEATVFEVTGIDLGGTLYLKDGKKAWFVVFTCAVYRAVHLELVTSLSTKALVAAMERFFSRRIIPSIIYSDNGTNLVGVFNEMKKVKGLALEWRFNPPAAPWWGGWWERIVGMVKKLLVRVLGRGTVDYEEMTTILTCCEKVINSRPLTYLSEDPSDLSPLTPAMFLHEEKPEGQPDLDALNLCNFGEEFRKRKKLMEQFRKRFRDEYLSKLIHHEKLKPQRTVEVDDLVLVEQENKKRICWPLARVLKVHHGKDGLVRAVVLRTATGEFTRAIQRVFPLEVPRNQFQATGPTEEVDLDKISTAKTFTRVGRESKIPDRFSY